MTQRTASLKNKPRPARPPAPSLKYHLGIGLVLALVTLVTYSPALHGTFLNYDDQESVAQNPDYVHPETAELSHYWGRAYLGLYTPVSFILLGLVAPMAQLPAMPGRPAGLDPEVFHAMSLLVHVVSALWAYAILQDVLRVAGRARPAALLAAGVGAMLFAIHPIQTEAVAWVTSFNTALSGMLALWAIWHGWRYAVLTRDGVPDRRDNVRRRVHWLAGLSLFILAMLSKPAAIVAPLVLAVLVLLVLRLPWRPAARLLLPWLLGTLPIAIVARLSQPAGSLVAPPLVLRPLVAADALTFYLTKLVAPLTLLPDYGRTPQAIIAHGWVYWTWIGAATLGLVAWALRRRMPALGVGYLMFIAALLPVLGLTSFEHQTISTVADRYAYLAMLGPALIAAFLVAGGLDRWPTPTRLATVALLASLAIATNRQSTRWHDDDRLFGYVLERNPTSLAAHRVLGFDAGQRGNFADALSHFNQAIQTRPGDGFSEFQLGDLYLRTRHPAEAVPHYRVAAVEMSNRGPLFNNLGIALLQTDRIPEALDAFQHAARTDPPSADAHANIAMVLAHNGDLAGATAEYQAALKINPDLPSAQRGLAEIQQALLGGQPPQAVPNRKIN